MSKLFRSLQVYKRVRTSPRCVSPGAILGQYLIRSSYPTSARVAWVDGRHDPQVSSWATNARPPSLSVVVVSPCSVNLCTLCRNRGRAHQLPLNKMPCMMMIIKGRPEPPLKIFPVLHISRSTDKCLLFPFLFGVDGAQVVDMVAALPGDDWRVIIEWLRAAVSTCVGWWCGRNRLKKFLHNYMCWVLHSQQQQQICTIMKRWSGCPWQSSFVGVKVQFLVFFVPLY